MSDRPKNLHNITRIDGGWWVRVDRGGNVRSKFFADSKHGGRAGALARARSHRAELLAALPPPARARARPPEERGRVYQGERSYRNAAGELVTYEAFIAEYPKGAGGMFRSSYSISAWGKAGAKRKAEAYLRARRTAAVAAARTAA